MLGKHPIKIDGFNQVPARWSRTPCASVGFDGRCVVDNILNRRMSYLALVDGKSPFVGRPEAGGQ